MSVKSTQAGRTLSQLKVSSEKMSFQKTKSFKATSPLKFEALRMLEEVRSGLECDLAAARHSLERLLGILERAESDSSSDKLVSGGLAPWQLRRVREHIAAHLAEPLPIEQLAAVARLSASHFARAFRVSVGVSPHAFIMSERIERAKRLMLETDEPIREIALSCGLADQAHLTRLFTRGEGLSPAAWRRLHMNCPAAERAA